MQLQSFCALILFCSGRFPTHDPHLQVYSLSRSDFVREVTEDSKEVWVAVLLYKDGIPESKLLEQLWPRVRCCRAHRVRSWAQYANLSKLTQPRPPYLCIA